MGGFRQKGYLTILDWIRGEVARRGVTDPQSQQWRKTFSDSFNDMADEFGSDEAKGRANALAVSEGGGSCSIPVHYWRGEDRAQLINRERVYLAIGSTHGTHYRVFIKEEFRLNGAAETSPSKTTEAAPAVAQARPGRTVEYDWEAAINDAWRAYYLGDLKPKSAADVRRHIQAFLSGPEGGPGDTEAKRRAALIFRTIQSLEG